VQLKAQGGERRLIKIGIEVSHEKLQHDLLMHPARYFFILQVKERAFLCIRTCNQEGEDITSHIIDGLMPDGEGNLVSVFETGLKDAIIEHFGQKKITDSGTEYPISSHLAWIISMMPDLVRWIFSTILSSGRNLVLNPLEVEDPL